MPRTELTSRSSSGRARCILVLLRFEEVCDMKHYTYHPIVIQYNRISCCRVFRSCNTEPRDK